MSRLGQRRGTAVEQRQDLVGVEGDLVGDAQVAELKGALTGQGILWVAYPKGGTKAKKETDLNRDILAAYLQEKGLQAVAQVAVDDTWSALRFKTVNGG